MDRRRASGDWGAWRRIVATAGLWSALATPPLRGDDDATVMLTTYEAREAALPWLQPPSVDSLALPWIRTRRDLRPGLLPAGGTPTSDGLPEPRHLWTRVAWDARHEEFLLRWQQSTDDTSRERLAGWCESVGLSDCAEFVLRTILVAHQDTPEAAVYGRTMPRWRPYGARRASPFVVGAPVRGVWKVLVDTSRHHQQTHFNAWAYDLVLLRGQSLFTGDNRVENYHAWEQPVVAVADGIVVFAVDHFADHQVGRLAPVTTANFLHIDLGGGIYASYTHLRQSSLRVRRGDRVRAGDVLGLVGNSGATDVPHLHFSLMDADGFSIPGRYRLHVWNGLAWHPGDGDLHEGTFIHSRTE